MPIKNPILRHHSGVPLVPSLPPDRAQFVTSQLDPGVRSDLDAIAERLFGTLERLAADGVSILFISHKLDEIRRVTHRCAVLRAGRLVAIVDPRRESEASLARLMIGADPPAIAAHDSPAGAVALSVRGLDTSDAPERERWLHDLEIELLAPAGVDELDVAARACYEAADLIERSLCRRQSDPLQRPVEKPLQTLEGECEVRSALGPRDGVDLVEDDSLDPMQRLARLRGQQEVERLGSRDEDVGRPLEHPPALVSRRVARAHADSELGAQPRERAPQVPLDVVVERLERGDVEQAETSTGRLVEPIDAGEECSEGLAGSGRRLDEDVPAARDRRPAELLRLRRLGECALEPLPRPW